MHNSRETLSPSNSTDNLRSIIGRNGVWQTQRKIQGKWEPKGIWGEQKKEKDKEKDDVAPFCLNTDLMLVLLESNYDL